MANRRQALLAANQRAMYVCLYQIGESIVAGWGLFSDMQTAEMTMRNHIEHMHRTHGVPCRGGVVKVLLEANDQGNGSDEPWSMICDDDKGPRWYRPEDTPSVEEHISSGRAESDGAVETEMESTDDNNEPW